MVPQWYTKSVFMVQGGKRLLCPGWANSATRLYSHQKGQVADFHVFKSKKVKQIPPSGRMLLNICTQNKDQKCFIKKLLSIMDYNKAVNIALWWH